ncbi:Versican core protein [Toxocara canis]|uniref:Versican core protein n=1 Tax=Toxocara canis TaxID=6265 RepID=A0A0B2UXT3_TOXCA|nr:Versican core protein [Toxocara canis]
MVAVEWAIRENKDAGTAQQGGAHNYYDGAFLCAKLGATPASILNADEQYFVNTLVLASGGKAYWIGMRKVGNSYIWTDGSPVTYMNWRPTQPDGCCPPDVTCVLVNYHDAIGQWEDAGCVTIWRSPLYTVCKKPL